MNVYHVVFVILCIFVIFLLFIASQNASINSNFEYEIINYKIRNNAKTILYWDTFYGNNTMGLGLGTKIFENCPVNNCLTTHDKQLLPVEYYDAILFHGARYEIKKNGQPNQRSNKQKYIFYSWESAYNSQIDDKTINNFYNWTMTYRKDSDIYYPYGVIEKQRTNYVLPSNEFINNKTKMVAWLASNCYTRGGRLRKSYVNKLKEHIPIDIYGHCGNLSCPHTDDCYKMLANNYKFYLSFENSFCPDYVTEKLFNILNYNIIPIVWGGANYFKIVPQNSVIHARAFESIETLSKFLNVIASNNTLYLQYFNWKKDYIVKSGPENALCDLCKKLNEPLVYTSYKNIKTWLYDKCTSLMV